MPNQKLWRVLDPEQYFLTTDNWLHSFKVNFDKGTNTFNYEHWSVERPKEGFGIVHSLLKDTSSANGEIYFSYDSKINAGHFDVLSCPNDPSSTSFSISVNHAKKFMIRDHTTGSSTAVFASRDILKISHTDSPALFMVSIIKAISQKLPVPIEGEGNTVLGVDQMNLIGFGFINIIYSIDSSNTKFLVLFYNQYTLMVYNIKGDIPKYNTINGNVVFKRQGTSLYIIFGTEQIYYYDLRHLHGINNCLTAKIPFGEICEDCGIVDLTCERLCNIENCKLYKLLDPNFCELCDDEKNKFGDAICAEICAEGYSYGDNITYQCVECPQECTAGCENFTRECKEEPSPPQNEHQNPPQNEPENPSENLRQKIYKIDTRRVKLDAEEGMMNEKLSFSFELLGRDSKNENLQISKEEYQKNWFKVKIKIREKEKIAKDKNIKLLNSFNGEKILQIQLEYPENIKTLKIEITTNPKIYIKNNTRLIRKEAKKEFEISLKNYPTEEELKLVKKMAKTVNTPMKKITSSEEGQTILTTIIAMDITGTIARFAMIMRVFGRLSYVNIYLGRKFSTFIKMIDLDKTIQFEDEKKLSKKNKQVTSKLAREKVVPSVEKYMGIRLYIYLFFCLIRLGIWIVISIFKGNKAYRSVCWFKFLIEKIHFFLFEATIMDGMFYGIYAAFFVKGLWDRDKIVGFVVSLFYVTDLLMLWAAKRPLDKGFSFTVINKKQKEEIKEKLEDSKNQLLDDSLKENSKIAKTKKKQNVQIETSAKLKASIDNDMTVYFLDYNTAMLDFHMNGIKETEINSSTSSINYWSMTRLIIPQLLIPATQSQPLVCYSLLFCTNLAYIFWLALIYIKNRNWVSIVDFVSKVVFSVLLSVFSIFAILLGLNDQKEEEPSLLLQDISIYLILAGILFEYLNLILCLLVSISYFIYDCLNSKKNLQKKWTRSLGVCYHHLNPYRN